MPVLRTQSHGDLYVEVFVETPVNLTKKQREILRSFAETANEKTSPESASFFDKVKGLWTEAKE